MNKTRSFALVAALCATLVLCLAPLADAKRFGGGRSFGSKPSMQRSFTPTPQQAPQMNRTQNSTAQKQNATNQTAQQPKRSIFGGMGGFLGGMLAGGLLGSLLFGGGFGGIPSIIDLLLIALVGYGIYKFISMRRRDAQAKSQVASAGGAGYANPERFGNQHNYSDQSHQSTSGWDSLRTTPASGAAPSSIPAGPVVPEGFDIEDFIKGAKMAFTRLQSSWDRRDADDIALFASPHVLNEVREQMKEDPTPSTTEILLINANLLSVVDEDGTQTATVYFDVLLREDPTQQASTSVREVWHFIRPTGSQEMWRLDGIQQVEQ